MLIDAHAHLDHYGAALEAALVEIRQQQIFTVSTAMDPPSYGRAREIAERCDLVLPTFGIHPWRAPAYVDRLAQYRTDIERSPILGEIGLDCRWVKDLSCHPAQRRVFEYFLAAAREQGKIVNLHTAGAEAAVLQLLERYDIQRAIIHWYAGPLDIFHALVQRGYSFTIGVEVHSSAHIQAIARALPASQLLTETDNPGGARWLTGELGMPALLRGVVRVLAALRSTSEEAIAQTVQENFVRLIQDDPWLEEVRGKFVP
ncbi:MAG: TatD family hydrolase [Candidatus Binatia bacterium]|nr:TatD family hydrolase [Candidatus Binatia bacterium]